MREREVTGHERERGNRHERWIDIKHFTKNMTDKDKKAFPKNYAL